MASSSGAPSTSGAAATQMAVEEIKPKRTVGIPTFDLESYGSAYLGHTKILRLIFIAEHCPELEKEAYKLSIDEVKKTINTALFKELTIKAGDRLGPEYKLDQSWVDAVDKKSQQNQDKLDSDLSSYKTNLIKESIRMGHNDLGDFHYDRGDLNSALRSYVRTRDYCTTAKHVIQMCLNVIKVSIEMGNFAHVINYVNKAEATPDLSDNIVIAKLRACAGLAHLAGGKYKLAAKKFLETSFDINNNFAEVIAPQDIAVYGGLCALATFDRAELKSKVIDNNPFKNFLELTPDIRELILDFYSSRYASCLTYLQKMKNDLLLDIHLHEHVDKLYQEIRNKALIQYFNPFISVNLNSMATAFNTNVTGLEKELTRLIMDNKIQARIDSHNKILYARHADQRSTTFHKSLNMGETYQNSVQSMLLRSNLLMSNFVVQPPKERDPRELGRDYNQMRD